MDEDTWLCIEDDSSHSASDSDVIDSETEAELYSTIHYEQNIGFEIPNSGPVNCKNAKLNDSGDQDEFLSPAKNSICVPEKQLNDIEENKISSQKYMSSNKFIDDSNFTKKFKVDSRSKMLHLNSNVFEIDSCQSLKSKSEKFLNIAQCSSNKKQPKKGDSTLVFDSTDSDDSLIWKDCGKSVDKSDFTINLSGEDEDIVYISSSDSDSEMPSASSHAFLRRESVLKNLSMPNLKIGEKREGQWYINSEDLYRSKKFSRRYHNNIDLLCTNCNRKGHNFKTCQEPKVLKCFICGGAHLGSRCPNRICGTCFGYGHDRKRCHMGPNFFFCELCSMYGHNIQNCPDLWRRYHLTTNPVRIVHGKQIKQDSNIYCWNCGQVGHFGGICQNGFSRNNINTWPCVISYDDPRDMFRVKRMFQERNLEDSRIRYNFRLNGEVQTGERLTRKQKKAKNRLKKKNKKIQDANNNKEIQSCSKSPSEEIPSRNKSPSKEIELCNKKVKAINRRINNIVKKMDFPRSPKQIVSKQCDEIPRSVEILMKKRLKKERTKLKRQLQYQQRLTKNVQSAL